MSGPPPPIDMGARRRLTERFGDDVGSWFDELPDLLNLLADRWRFEFLTQIPRGSVAVVFRCLIHDGRRAVLKASPDRGRLATEAAALIHWHGDRAPAVFEFDDELGALMIEEIDPGTALLETPHVLSPEAVGNLLNALHQTEGLEFSFPSVAQRVDYLFRSSTKLYDRHPDLVAVVPKRLYERGYELAIQLAQSGDRDVLLHGDLTPSNVLQGGANRGLVAIDPAPCLGDPAFDAIDLVMWKADDLDSIDARVSRLATITHVDQQRLRSWCSAFAGMSALEISSLGASGAQVEVLTSLAQYK